MTNPNTYPRVWENVSQYCKRLKVPGGWLVDVWTEEAAHAVCFVPDASYSWVLVDN